MKLDPLFLFLSHGLSYDKFSALTLTVTTILLALSVLPGYSQSQTPAWASGTWEIFQADDLPMQRHEHGYVEANGLFYLMGGRGDRPVQVFDPALQTWATRGLPPFQIHHFQPVEYDGKIYVMGAFTEGFPYEKPIPNIYIYDPVTDKWTKGPEIPENRRRGAAGLVVHNDDLYVVSGIQNGHADGHVTWFDRFDPKTGVWEILPDAPHARDHFQAVVIGGKLYAAGGRRSSYATGQSFELTIPEVDVYDFSAGTWTTLPSSANLPTERAGVTAMAYNGKLVVIGGESARGISTDAGNSERPPAHAEVEVFDPMTAQWFSMPPLRQGRHATQAIVYQDKIYIAAGSRTIGGTEINSQEVYTPSGN
jgi:hypothetical protein